MGKRKYMNWFSFCEELEKRGFKWVTDEDWEWDGTKWVKADIIVLCYGGYIEGDELFPYTIMLNDRKVIGNQRCLSYIDKILEEKNVKI